MKYVVLKNFIDKKTCESLIQGANKFIDYNNHIVIHKNRIMINASNSEYSELLKSSIHWDNLNKKFNSPEFLKFCLDKININSENFCLKDFFKIKNPSFNQKIYKRICNSKTKLVPDISLVKFLLYRFYRNIYRNIKFSKIFYPKTKPVELLYDYSRAGDGYSIEVHRDSDSRLAVFLLFLNSLPEDSNATGGNLHFHKLIKEDKNLSRPSNESCEEIEKIKPEPGTLVIFSNENDSYHSVSEMKGFKDKYRYFIYGGFTLLSQRNPLITGKTKQDTSFHIYE